LKKKVSVIIPVLNAADLLGRVLQALSDQTYPRNLFEIIVVDNGSTDNSMMIAESFEVKILKQREIQSPYAARNLGFDHAGGTIIALTDANKIPEKHWIEEGVKAIVDGHADLAGGQISFELKGNSTAAEVYDSITYNDNQMFVSKLRGAASGNLFFKKDILNNVGKFPDAFRSGMDIWWTARAVKNGYTITFAENAVVYCQPRKLKDLLRKSYRVGILHPVIFKQQGKSLSYILGQTIRTFAPPKISQLKQKLEAANHSHSLSRIYVVAWMNKMMMGFGRIKGLSYVGKEINGSVKK